MNTEDYWDIEVGDTVKYKQDSHLKGSAFADKLMHDLKWEVTNIRKSDNRYYCECKTEINGDTYTTSFPLYYLVKVENTKYKWEVKFDKNEEVYSLEDGKVVEILDYKQYRSHSDGIEYKYKTNIGWRKESVLYKLSDREDYRLYPDGFTKYEGCGLYRDEVNKIIDDLDLKYEYAQCGDTIIIKFEDDYIVAKDYEIMEGNK